MTVVQFGMVPTTDGQTVAIEVKLDGQVIGKVPFDATGIHEMIDKLSEARKRSPKRFRFGLMWVAGLTL